MVSSAGYCETGSVTADLLACAGVERFVLPRVHDVARPSVRFAQVLKTPVQAGLVCPHAQGYSGGMKTFTVQEAQAQLGQLIAEANQGNVIVLTDGQQKVTLQPGAALDLDEDSPELEAELLKGIDGPYTPYSSEEMRGIVERIIREEKRT